MLQVLKEIFENSRIRCGVGPKQIYLESCLIVPVRKVVSLQENPFANWMSVNFLPTLTMEMVSKSAELEMLERARFATSVPGIVWQGGWFSISRCLFVRR